MSDVSKGTISRLLNLAACQAFYPVNKGLVKGKKSVVSKTRHKVHGIGKTKPSFVQLDDLVQDLRVVHMNNCKAEKFGQPLSDSIRFELVCKTKHPFGFQENRISDEDLLGGNDFFSFEKLLFIVPGE